MAQGAMSTPPVWCLEDSFGKQEVPALSLEGWLPFRPRAMEQANASTERGRWRPTDQGQALGSLKGYSMFWQRKPCADLLVCVLVQLPTYYAALGHSCVSEQLQEGVGNDHLASLTWQPESAK